MKKGDIKKIARFRKLQEELAEVEGIEELFEDEGDVILSTPVFFEMAKSMDVEIVTDSGSLRFIAEEISFYTSVDCDDLVYLTKHNTKFKLTHFDTEESLI